MAQDIDSALEELKEYYIQKAKDDLVIAMDYANDKMFEELNNMYNTFIKQFYRYKTKSYIRHWEGVPGTKKGTNLYYGNHIKIRYSNKLPYLDININSEDMATYKHDSAETVLNQVLSGTLEVHGSKGYTVYSREWTGKYIGKYYSFEGSPNDAFLNFYDQFMDIFIPVFMNKWNSLGWL